MRRLDYDWLRKQFHFRCPKCGEKYEPRKPQAGFWKSEGPPVAGRRAFRSVRWWSSRARCNIRYMMKNENPVPSMVLGSKYRSHTAISSLRRTNRKPETSTRMSTKEHSHLDDGLIDKGYWGVKLTEEHLLDEPWEMQGLLLSLRLLLHLWQEAEKEDRSRM